MSITGGCHCGTLRFIAASDPVECGYCHCLICQRTTGAAVLIFNTFKTSDFRYEKGVPTVYPSSHHGTRELCDRCGTQIAYRPKENTEFIDVNSGAHDDPEQLSPQYHIWFENRLPWLNIDDNLPRYPREKPELV
ncbi:MAG: GFA family protein [Pseudomonadota bacterium]